MKLEEQQKAVRSGYDIDLLPTDLVSYGEDAKNLLQELQNRNERLFLVTVLLINLAENAAQLAEHTYSARAVAQKHNCTFNTLDYQQEEGLISSLPLGETASRFSEG